MTAITALTAQNSLGVQAVMAVPPAFVAAQIRSVLSDFGADAIKIGMVHDLATIVAIDEILQELAPTVPIILDPVMVAKGGASLLQPDAVEALCRLLIPRAILVTPNLPEAEALLGERLESLEQRQAAGTRLLALGAAAVLLKGGHAQDSDGKPSREIVDQIFTWNHNHRPESQTVSNQNPQNSPNLANSQSQENSAAVAIWQRDFVSARLDTVHSHGTGCCLASAIATGVAQGMTLMAAIERARHFVYLALANAPGLGAGHGPLNHSVTVCSSEVAPPSSLRKAE